MADLTSLSNLDFAFDPAAVTAVTDRDENGNLVTCIYGLSPRYQQTNEPWDTFLTRIGLRDKFAKLTRPDGFNVWVNSALKVVRSPVPGEHQPNVNAVLSVGGDKEGQAVQETVATVKQAVNSCGGKL